MEKISLFGYLTAVFFEIPTGASDLWVFFEKKLLNTQKPTCLLLFRALFWVYFVWMAFKYPKASWEPPGWTLRLR